ncbi:cation:proton antiporter [Thermobifida halotolerans]|uniref:Cation:proton antiporter n=1 Tax=Thermobifida halotolerans TaxID=483545 RepID=A0A399G9F4_9ACTN|nr:cation:proton antiporter [Thermobifida halotolerans]UOE20724.1 cation:proton antiporter [Thermobifida halotolerans]
MDPLHLAYAAIGALSVVLALFSSRLRELPVSEPLMALLLGVLLGPHLLGLLEFSTTERDSLLLEGARVLLAASVMAAALRFPATSLRGLIAPAALLLGVVMPLAAVLSGAAALLLGLPVALAALVGACLCPTDPVLAASVVTGKPAEEHLPGRLRRMLTVESGANDGLALPLVGLALAVVLPATAPGAEVGRLAWEVAAGAVIGVVAGAAAGRAMEAATDRRKLGKGASLVFTLLLAVAVLGLARIAGASGVLAVFASGLAYNRVVRTGERGPQDNIDEAINRYLSLPLFVLLGAVLPWREWIGFGPVALLFVVAVLLLRRPPLILALFRPLGLRPRDAAFLGWFGPMGISALFYLAHSIDKGVHDPRLFAAVSLAVTASVLVHGITSSPAVRVYARSSEASERG